MSLDCPSRWSLRPFGAAPAFFGNWVWFTAYDPLTLILSSDTAKQIATWIDIGTQDRWRDEAESLYVAQQAQQAPVAIHLLEGEHAGWYWKEYLPEYLHFYSKALTTETRTAEGAPLVHVQPLATSITLQSLALPPALRPHSALTPVLVTGSLEEGVEVEAVEGTAERP